MRRPETYVETAWPTRQAVLLTTGAGLLQNERMATPQPPFPTVSWSADLHGQAMDRIVSLAIEKLTPAQARCFLLHFVEGWTEQRIADAYDCKREAVHQSLWGQGASKAPLPPVQKLHAARPPVSRLDVVFRSNNKGSGAVSQLSKAIKSDSLMQMIISRAAEPTVERASRDLDGWFEATRHRPDYFCAYATLILLDNLADAKGRIGITELARQMSPAIINVVLGQLRAFGFIDNNIEPGIIRILKLPGERPVRPALLATSAPSATHVDGDDLQSPEDKIIENIDNDAAKQEPVEAPPVKTAIIDAFADDDESFPTVPKT